MASHRVGGAAIAALLALSPLYGGCPGDVEDDDDSVTGTGTVTGTATGTGTGVGVSVPCGPFDTTGGEGSCAELCLVDNEESCQAHGASVDCAALRPGMSVEACGVALPAPMDDGNLVELERSAAVQEHGGSGPVALSCLLPGGLPPPPDPGASQPVTVVGKASVVSNGCQSSDLEIALYTVRRTGGADEAEPDQLVGQVVVTDSDCSIQGVAEPGVEGCGADDVRWECSFSYPGVPTETELVVVTRGAVWAPIYEYGWFIANGQVSAGEYRRDVHALSNDDYQTLAQITMGSTITPGHGMVMGEVHDCEDVRLLHAVVDVDGDRTVATYFDDDEQKPLPALGVRSTASLGLYAAMDIAPGLVTVAAAGVSGGTLLSVGHLRARVHPDAATWVSFAGPRPFVAH